MKTYQVDFTVRAEVQAVDEKDAESFLTTIEQEMEDRLQKMVFTRRPKVSVNDYWEVD